MDVKRPVIIAIVMGVLLIGSIILAMTAKSIMDVNAEFEQALALVEELIVPPESALGKNILQGHLVYQTALLVNQIAMGSAIGFGIAFGIYIQPFLKRTK